MFLSPFLLLPRQALKSKHTKRVCLFLLYSTSSIYLTTNLPKSSAAHPQISTLSLKTQQWERTATQPQLCLPQPDQAIWQRCLMKSVQT